MHNSILSLCFAFLMLFNSFELMATRVVVLVNDTIFFPDTVMLQQSDTILWQFTSGNYSVQVSQSTWINNGYNPLAGGLNFSASDSIWVLDTSGVFYFVSPPNAIFGSKGVVMVPEPQATKQNELHEPFLLYPNPASGTLFIRLNANAANSLLSLTWFDIQGKCCFTNLLSGCALHPISLETLSPGMYVIEIASGGTLYRKRVQILP